jgi:EAL domain-containing protein (putative c-di-GMP-specific phosphodiesterase class I)/ActR/RegA family two-component response regulator
MEPSPAGSSEPRLALVIDAEAQARVSVCRSLQESGWSVLEAATGEAALELVGGRPIDAVVCDVTMPGMDGIDFLRSVHEQQPDLPVVMVTGAPALDTATRAIEFGAFRYLKKPVAPDLLASTLDRAWQLHRLAKLKREALELVGAEAAQVADRTALEQRFSRALERLWIAYQPIVLWSERLLLGYEALVRSGDPSLATPAALLAAAERLGKIDELGRAIRAAVVPALEQAGPDALLFINVHAHELAAADFLGDGSPLADVAPHIVLEITERSSLARVPELDARLRRLRGQGFRFAVDDLGGGYAGVSSLTLLEPDFVKLDRALVMGLDESPRRRSVVRAMVRLCTYELGIQMIALGVESPAERDALAREGVDLMQGELFAAPARDFPLPRF